MGKVLRFEPRKPDAAFDRGVTAEFDTPGGSHIHLCVECKAELHFLPREPGDCEICKGLPLFFCGECHEKFFMG